MFIHTNIIMLIHNSDTSNDSQRMFWENLSLSNMFVPSSLFLTASFANWGSNVSSRILSHPLLTQAHPLSPLFHEHIHTATENEKWGKGKERNMITFQYTSSMKIQNMNTINTRRGGDGKHPLPSLPTFSSVSSFFYFYLSLEEICFTCWCYFSSSCNFCYF